MSLKIGWSEKSITPDKKISLVGQFAERISEYVEKPLTVTALAIDSGDDQVVMVSCDLGSVSWNLLQDVRARLADNDVGLDPQKIIMSAIHTHTGPGYKGSGQKNANKIPTILGLRQTLEQFLTPGQKYVEKVNITSNPDIATTDEVWELLMQQIPAAVLEAWNNRKPGSFSNAFGRAAVGMCRRAAYNDNTAQMWGDTNTAVFPSRARMPQARSCTRLWAMLKRPPDISRG